MVETIQFQSRVGKDGVLDIHVPLGDVEAGTEVLVTIHSLPKTATRQILNRSHWHQFVEDTYGSCADLGIERLAQGAFEKREAIE